MNFSQTQIKSMKIIKTYNQSLDEVTNYLRSYEQNTFFSIGSGHKTMSASSASVTQIY